MPRKKQTRDSVKKGLDWKFWVGLTIAIFGLILSAIAARARPTISIESPLDPSNISTSVFVISNDGILDLHKLEIECYFRTLIDAQQNLVKGVLAPPYDPPDDTLEIGEKKTVSFDRLFDDKDFVDADMAVVVRFRPDYFPFNRERIFRFVGKLQSNGRLRLEEQPAGNIKQEYSDARELFLKTEGSVRGMHH